MSAKHIWSCLFGPRLFKVYLDGAHDKLYSPHTMELLGERIISSLNFILNVGVYATPLVGMYLYKRDYSNLASLAPLIKFVTSVGLVTVVSLCMRGYGRVTNPQYNQFIETFTEAVREPRAGSVALRKYDFDFTFWPVDFDGAKVKRTDKPKFMPSPSMEWNSLHSIIMNIVGLVSVNTFGLKLIYPGSTTILNMFVDGALLEGRIKLVEGHNGKRYKLNTNNMDNIDCMFVDRRGISPNGDVLVVTSEGNAGFYEIGIMTTPIDAGYSVLGWNHPGFGCSTGYPLPLREQHAMDAVMQFAINELNFKPKSILLFGWSIGCYTTAWASIQYPDVKGIILDATFDDILPLAESRMPTSWKSLVREVIRGHVNLNIADILKEYSGPVKLIRRTLDEIICLEESKLSTNRGNDLLIKILSDRYPNLFGTDQYNLIRKYLSLQGPALTVFILSEHPGDMDKNKKVLFLLKEYLVDYQSTHCTPLPTTCFQVPREIVLEEDFVYT